MTDERLEQLNVWVAQQLNSASQPLEVVSGDASFRRYFRWPGTVNQPTRYIAVDSPPDKEPIDPFLKVAALFRDAGVSVPEVIASDAASGFMLLSDFGDRLFLPELKAGNAEPLYHDALNALVTLQAGCRTTQQRLPPYDKALLHREMELFREWFLIRHLQMPLTQRDHRMLDLWFDRLSERALKQPQVAVHRDYHSRNLMVLAERSPGIIDFQDAVEGAITYDLISLLKDCYICWPRERQLHWLRQYAELAGEQQLPVNYDDAFVTDFDWMGLQRHIKVAGIFCRLNHRDGKAAYMRDIPLTLGYIVQVLQHYSEFSEILDWFEQRLKPLVDANGLTWQTLQ